LAITATEDSELARAAQIVLAYGKHPEACHLNLAPSTSTMLMLALGDALCLVTARRRNWTAYDFSQHHPGGSLGLQLSNVEEIMRPLAQCRVAPQELTVREVFIKVSTTARRTGAVLLVDPVGKLAGLFTDSDLAKLLEQQRDGSLDRPISEVMTRRPYQVSEGTKTTQAVQMLARHNISELPVVNSSGQPTGIIDITDVLNLMPTNFTPPTVQPSEHEDPEPITLKIHHDSI
jgi:arabinose-5-phosphate isomerase